LNRKRTKTLVPSECAFGAVNRTLSLQRSGLRLLFANALGRASENQPMPYPGSGLLLANLSGTDRTAGFVA
jgi:hypothetical protein